MHNLMFHCAGKGPNDSDIVTSCPQIFVTDEVNNITCEVNSSIHINSTGRNTSLDFIHRSTNYKTTVMCSTSFPPRSCMQSTVSTPCFCASKTNNTYIFQYNMMVYSSSANYYKRGMIYCRLSPYLTPFPQEYVTPNCLSTTILGM